MATILPFLRGESKVRNGAKLCVTREKILER